MADRLPVDSDVTLMCGAADMVVGGDSSSDVLAAKALTPSADGSSVHVADFSG
jgi:hypothetical protein